MCTLKDYEDLQMDEEHRNYVNTELDLWHKYYLPKDIKGKVVLDLGAGCGETIQFYLLHGASQVIAIESDIEKMKYIRNNFKEEIIKRKVIAIRINIDLIKSDIEGSEKDMIIETHFLPYFKRLQLVGRGKHGPAILYQLSDRKQFSNLLGYLHMRRIYIAHFIRNIIDSI